MKFSIFKLFTLLCMCFLCCENAHVSTEKEDAIMFLDEIYKNYNMWSNKQALANWNYASNLTDQNLATKLQISSQMANFSKTMWRQVKDYPWQNLKDENLRRQFKKLSLLGWSILPEEQYKEYNKLISSMQNIYSTAKLCDFKDKSKCSLSLEPELMDIMAKSRNPEELKYVWSEWRKASGRKIKPLFEKYVELSNLGARMNNFSDTSAAWLYAYEADDIVDQIDTLWEQIKPFYLQIHAYVRYKLNKFYGDDVVLNDGLIPAHLLGNMWSQKWGNINPITIPFPDKQFPDVSEEMKKQDYDVNSMFRLAESCFTSMNMSAMPETFWRNSIIEKPDDREMICHASAWDMSDGKDFRIKMCTEITLEHLMTIHHEMGHIQYYLQYKHQPIVFRRGANPGFHEAVGDVMSLSVSTPNHLHKIGLLKSRVDTANDNELIINELFSKSLDKIVFLPFSYVIDKLRWNIFQGKVSADKYNCEWWNLRDEYQGIESPVERDEDDFDPGAKYHVAANVEYLRYFISHVIQFQFHKALCIAAEEYDPNNSTSKPLYNCDITSSTKAGNLLKSMLQMGSSKPWQDAMEVLTGQRIMDASGLLEYFKPLHDWLIDENRKNGVKVGWTSKNNRCNKAE